MNLSEFLEHPHKRVLVTNEAIHVTAHESLWLREQLQRMFAIVSPPLKDRIRAIDCSFAIDQYFTQKGMSFRKIQLVIHLETLTAVLVGLPQDRISSSGNVEVFKEMPVEDGQWLPQFYYEYVEILANFYRRQILDNLVVHKMAGVLKQPAQNVCDLYNKLEKWEHHKAITLLYE